MRGVRYARNALAVYSRFSLRRRANWRCSSWLNRRRRAAGAGSGSGAAERPTWEKMCTATAEAFRQRGMAAMADEIGNGTHHRIVIDLAKFNQRLARKSGPQ